MSSFCHSTIMSSVSALMAAVCKLRIPCKRFLILLSHRSLACEDSQSKPPNANVQPRTRVSFNSVLLNLKCVALLSKCALSCCEWHHLSLFRSVGNATLFSQCSKIPSKVVFLMGFHRQHHFQNVVYHKQNKETITVLKINSQTTLVLRES